MKIKHRTMSGMKHFIGPSISKPLTLSEYGVTKNKPEPEFNEKIMGTSTFVKRRAMLEDKNLLWKSCS